MIIMYLTIPIVIIKYSKSMQIMDINVLFNNCSSVSVLICEYHKSTLKPKIKTPTRHTQSTLFHIISINISQITSGVKHMANLQTCTIIISSTRSIVTMQSIQINVNYEYKMHHTKVLFMVLL